MLRLPMDIQLGRVAMEDTRRHTTRLKRNIYRRVRWTSRKRRPRSHGGMVRVGQPRTISRNSRRGRIRTEYAILPTHNHTSAKRKRHRTDKLTRRKTIHQIPEHQRKRMQRNMARMERPRRWRHHEICHIRQTQHKMGNPNRPTILQITSNP